MYKVALNILTIVLAASLMTGCQETRQDDRVPELIARLSAAENETSRLRDELQSLNSEVRDRQLLQSKIIALLMDDRVGIWTDSNAMYFMFERPVRTNSAERLIGELNRDCPPPQCPGLELVKIERGLAHVRVIDPMHLANRMGTSGAAAYQGRATLTLTSIPTIDSVYYDFGDDFDPATASHAGPVTESRVRYARYVILR